MPTPALVRCLALFTGLLVAQNVGAQVAYPANGPTGAVLMQKAQQLQAAGNRAGAAATYQQAYAAYTSVDDSDGMKAALAGKKAAETGAGAAATPHPATAVATPRPAAPARSTAPARPAAAAPTVSSTAPLPGRTTGGKPVGLFYFTNVFNNEHIYYFTPAGQVYLDPIDFAPGALAALPAERRGSLSQGSGQMTVKWANGQAESHNTHFDPTGFGWNGSFVCVGPFASPNQLLSTFEGRNAAIATDANSLTVFRTLAFKPNGTFTRDNYASAHLEANTGLTNDVASASNQAGHWSLSGWFLTLADGRGTVRAIAFPTSTVDDTKTGKAYYFCFNGTTYKNTAAK